MMRKILYSFNIHKNDKIKKYRFFSTSKVLLEKNSDFEEKWLEDLTVDPGSKSFYINSNTTNKVKRNLYTKENEFYRNIYANKIANDHDIPSIVFDFRYTNKLKDSQIIHELVKELDLIIQKNLKAKNPFKINYCNYTNETSFDQKCKKLIDFDKNIIFEDKKSYLDLFPKEKLVYLSKDATDLVQYDANKIYIIGAIEKNSNTFKFASLAQSKKDGIRCESLPLDKYVKYIHFFILIFYF
jgi:hypothetical protein